VNKTAAIKCCIISAVHIASRLLTSI